MKAILFSHFKRFQRTDIRGGSRTFFRRGCTRLLLYFNTNKPHSFFSFLQNTSCIRKPQVISGGGGVRTPCPLPLDPPLDILSNRPMARFQDLTIFYNRIDFFLCNFHHFIISLILATMPYDKAKEIEMIEKLAVTHGNVRCVHNLYAYLSLSSITP